MTDILDVTVHQQIRQLALEALRHSDGRLEEARQRVRTALLQNKALLDALIREVIDAAVENCVGLEHRSENARILRSLTGEKQAVELLLFDMVLGSGTRLRAANRKDLAHEALFYTKQAAAMYVKATFFQHVRDCLPDDKTTVEQVLNEEQLRGLFEKARITKREVVQPDLPGTLDHLRGRPDGEPSDRPTV